MGKKKTAKTTVKKAKRGAPMKTCPKCSKKLHAAKGTCDCGYKFPAKMKKPVKTKTKRSVAHRSAGGVLSQRLEESIRIVETAGGLEGAKQTLAAVRELEDLK